MATRPAAPFSASSEPRPALAILPAGSALALAAMASPIHPDAALFAMGPAIEAADREFNAALDALAAADDAYSDKEPDGPAEPKPDFLPEELQALDLLGTAAALRAINGRSPAFVAYDHAVAAHEQEVERLKAECGVTAAHELEAATSNEVNSVKADLLDTPAKTLAGLIFKARYAAREDNAYDEDVMVSIVEDLLAMAAAGGLRRCLRPRNPPAVFSSPPARPRPSSARWRYPPPFLPSIRSSPRSSGTRRHGMRSVRPGRRPTIFLPSNKGESLPKPTAMRSTPPRTSNAKCSAKCWIPRRRRSRDCGRP